MEGIALLTDRNQPSTAPPGPTSPSKPRIQLQAVFDPPTAKIVPQRLFSPHNQEHISVDPLTRKAPPETASPVRSTKRRAVDTPRRIARTKSAAPTTTEDPSREKVDAILSPSLVQSATPTPSRIPTMMSSVKRMENKLGRSKSHTCIQKDQRAKVATPRPAFGLDGEDVFGSPTA